eukprot:4351340-Prymnesium_polylepis.1
MAHAPVHGRQATGPRSRADCVALVACSRILTAVTATSLTTTTTEWLTCHLGRSCSSSCRSRWVSYLCWGG